METSFFAYVLEFALRLLHDNGMKNVNNIQMGKVHPQGVAYSICLIFC